MLEMRPNCEHCDADLPADAPGAFICSFECTYCNPCADGKLGRTCPNCGGALVPRPTRGGESLERFPARKDRVLRTRRG